MAHFYWLSHRRYVDSGRMRWHAEQADEAFWAGYWRERVTPAYFRKAADADLSADEMGRVLLAEMPVEGRHLEAGCGAGYWVAALRAAGRDVEGIEYARDLVELVNEVCPELPVRYGDALAIDCPDNTYASYLSFGVVEHRQAGPEPFLAEAYRVLAPGGKLIITVPYLGPVRRLRARFGRYEATPPAPPFFQYGFRSGEFAGLVAGAGFVVETTRPLFFHRMLLEENAAYRWLYDRRYGMVWRRALSGLFDGRDGHMLMVIAHKPAG
ncbi:MAG TPA: class I SAM-dependent methyltransferase [Promineifilum sp.]|nr:class I SAM-dependent methyltransferase [Promineifilum sp.]HRO90579.1 class I SAM-dependent methyltransferase [Promineifilum sp.]HRQ12613.1 class I SAM-dependent methyltransferase [Promineifilum sp.]